MLRSALKISGGVLAVLIGAAVVLGLHDMVSFGADPPADPHGSVAARLARVAARPTLRLTHGGRHTGKPYAVTIWFVTDGDVVYLTTMDRRRQWVRNVSHSPRVTLEIGRERFAGTVRPVTAEAEKRREFELLAQK